MLAFRLVESGADYWLVVAGQVGFGLRQVALSYSFAEGQEGILSEQSGRLCF